MKRLMIGTAVFVIVVAGATAIIRHSILSGIGAQPADSAETSISTAITNTVTNPANPSFVPNLGKDFTLKDEHYFQNKSWYVATVTPTRRDAGEPAPVVMHLRDNAYEIVAGPGTSFSSQDLKDASVPDEVIDYLRSIGRVTDAAYMTR